jgi:hypothetical protein
MIMSYGGGRNAGKVACTNPLAKLTDDELIDAFVAASDTFDEDLIKPIADEMQRRHIDL